jgi:caffeoyl-CoA O-methyltransferase
MEFIDATLSNYLDRHCDAEPALLARINRETHVMQTQAHMLSGHYQGRLLSMLSRFLSPKRILEIGTFTGYATLCLAEGLPADGLIYTIDVNEELEERVKGYFEVSDVAAQIRYHIGDAAQVIPTLNESFDLVFIDADKKNNVLYVDLVLEQMPAGGVILIDNVLWKGKVFAEQTDKQTQQIIQMNEQIASDPRVEKLILPVRDGVFVLRKK